MITQWAPMCHGCALQADCASNDCQELCYPAARVLAASSPVKPAVAVCKYCGTAITLATAGLAYFCQSCTSRLLDLAVRLLDCDGEPDCHCPNCADALAKQARRRL